MKQVEYKNRYGDIHTFSKTEDGNLLWEGNFEWSRHSWPNVYDKAYEQYITDGGTLDLEDFKEEVHKAVYDKYGNYLHMSETNQKYGKLVYSDKNTIDMIDPSGGPYICEGMDMGQFSDELEGMIVEQFKKIKTDYKIIIKK